ncbi:MAG: M3 family oligoendopeptidase [Saprospiraceae bacterium]|nr:M3 family oligoendopeptidase [Saprospiraceae bacterium]MCB9342854.1 M3 family oligoendopeptidase [Lewinellaceae bacterium]
MTKLNDHPPRPFESFEYTRPDLEAFRTSFEQLVNTFTASKSAKAQFKVLQELNSLRNEFISMYNLCLVKHTCDTRDEFFEAENQYFDDNMPVYEELNTAFYQALLDSPFRSELEEMLGKQLFTLASLALKTFNPSIFKGLQQENALSTEYTKIKAQAKIEFNGETYNLSNLASIELSSDRNTRQKAAEAKWNFYANQAEAIEGIFDKMVKVRHDIAQKLGFKNFVEVGYARMRRSDYCPEMVDNFRKQVRELIVPLAGEIYKRQQKRLGLTELMYFDEEYKYPSGNPKPIGTPEQIVENAGIMYKELSPETDLFFQHMNDAHLMDLVNRDGKATGGYCTYISNYQAPFIFSNFNGTSDDIDVLTHEAGHAFQVWSSSHFPFEEYQWPTYEAAEVHSMSMEFFTWPWMRLFFGDQIEKYQFMHMARSLQFIPYGVAVDEFQHIVYANPDMTPEERNQAWRQLEKTYLPHRNYGDNQHLLAGRFWQRQNHIFNSPFYYIDYTLAQICAFQFWTKDRQDHEKAWNDYLHLCKSGGSFSFLELLKIANLRSPFEEGCVESVIGEIRNFLDCVDDSGF